MIVGLAVFLAGACSKPNADTHVRKANTYDEQSRLPEAIADYRLALQADPKRGDIRGNQSSPTRTSAIAMAATL